MDINKLASDPSKMAMLMGGLNMMQASRGGNTDLTKGGAGYALNQGLQGGLQGYQLANEMGQQDKKQKMINDMLMKLNLDPSAQASTGVLSPDVQQNGFSQMTPQQKEVAKMAIMSGDWKSLSGMMSPDQGMTPYQKEQIRLQEARLQKEAGARAFQPVVATDAEGNPQLVMPTYKDGIASAELVTMPNNLMAAVETPEQKRIREATVKAQGAGMETTAKGQAGRQQEYIDAGLTAADSMPNINRAIDLLNSVETGGFSNASLSAKKFFGVEGADEAELSNRLGKAVLSQLRTVFGAAFTENEGTRLTSIEASFGKSTEGNKRLLDQAKKITERAAKRGIAAARKTGDGDTAKEIEDALSFSLTTDKKSAIPEGVTEDDITATMKANNMTRQQVLEKLNGR